MNGDEAQRKYDAAGDRVVTVSDKSIVKLNISSWVHVIVILSVLIGIYYAIRGDVTAAIALGSQNAADIKAMQSQTQEMRIQVYGVADELKYFRQQYEHDQKR